jgi:hypothetical protein
MNLLILRVHSFVDHNKQLAHKTILDWNRPIVTV